MHASTRISLTIDGMTCGHCVGAVEKALASVPEISATTVAIGSAQFTVREGAPAQVAGDAIRAIAKAGYRAAMAPTGG